MGKFIMSSFVLIKRVGYVRQIFRGQRSSGKLTWTRNNLIAETFCIQLSGVWSASAIYLFCSKRFRDELSSRVLYLRCSGFSDDYMDSLLIENAVVEIFVCVCVCVCVCECSVVCVCCLLYTSPSPRDA